MSSTPDLSRRTFLKTSSVGTAAIIIGLTSPWDTKAVVQQNQAPKSVNPFPAWIRIEENGKVTLMAPRPDMGEGTLTSLPMIVAEELEVEWSSVTVEPAPANSRVYGQQSLGGSGSVTGSWQILRQIGASARVMLIAAAAAQWNVDKSSCFAEKGNVIHRPTNRRIAYGELIKKDLTPYVPELASVPLKKPEDFKVIGVATHKVELPAKVNGSAAFGLDVKVPGMLYAVVARCPAFGGKLIKFDASKAKAIAGVRDVFAIDPFPPHTAGGVAVVADSTWLAMKGREALQIDWDSGPNGKESSESLHAQFVSLAQKEGKVLRNDGDAATAIGSASKKIEAIYELPFHCHATMEPLNCTADVRSDKVEIWAATQAPGYGAQQVAKIAGIPMSPDAIVFHPQLIGGGFGRRYQMDFIIEAAQVSKQAGKPIKLTWSREDDMQHGFYRPASYHSLSAAINENGGVAAWRHRLLSTSIRQYFNANNPTPEAQEMDGAINVPYVMDNVRVEYACPQSGVPRAWWRSVSDSFNGFVVESFVDELAQAAKKDAVEFRLSMLDKSKIKGKKRDDVADYDRLRNVIKIAAEKGNWGKPMPAGQGRGFASHFSFDTYVAYVADVTVNANGSVKVDRVTAAVDCGQIINPDGVKAMVEGAIVYGLSAAMKDKITITDGRVQQSNFDDYRVLKINEMPVVDVHLVPSTEQPTGMGEPGLPPIAPAVTNAIFAATGKRIRTLPFSAADVKKA